MWRSARSFMSMVRGQVMRSDRDAIRCRGKDMHRSARRANCAPRRWRENPHENEDLIFALGSICESRHPRRRPFMPKTGPSDGSREVMMTFFSDMREPLRQADGSDGLPFSCGCGRGRSKTIINLPRRLNAGSESSCSLIFRPCEPKLPIFSGRQVCALRLESEEELFLQMSL